MIFVLILIMASVVSTGVLFGYIVYLVAKFISLNIEIESEQSRIRKEFHE